MKDLSNLVPSLERRLSEKLTGWVSGQLDDQSKSVRTGIVGATPTHVFFFREKLVGDEYLSMAAAAVVEVDVGASDGFGGPGGKAIPELSIEFEDGAVWRVTMIVGGDPQQLADALSAAS